MIRQKNFSAITKNISFFIFLLLLFGCEKQPKINSGILQENMDLSVSPGDNFMNYVNGTWLKNTNIPDDRAIFGVGNIVDIEIDEKVKNIIEACAQGAFEVGTDEQKVGDFYASFININLRNKKGISPLQPDLEKIDAINNYDDLARYFAFANKIGVNSPLQMHIWPDLKNSKIYNVYIQQNGLGLPDREYYLKEDKTSQLLREKYLLYITSAMEILELENPSSAAKSVLSLEKQLAEKQMRKEETRLYTKLYNVYGINNLNELTPNFNWKSYLNELGLINRDSVVLEMVDYTKSLDQILLNTSIEDWKIYLKWHLVNAMSNNLSENIYSTYFDFYKELFGVESAKPLWERGLRNVKDDLGQLVIKLYGKKHVSDETIKEVNLLIENIKQAFSESIRTSKWMSESTRKEAEKKLKNLTSTVVYQKKWEDYSALKISRDDFYGNKKRYLLFKYETELNNLNNLIDKDKTEIRLTSAYYDPSLNRFMLGAGYITSPYFDSNTDDAANYGALGSVIGHEIGHAFDKLGSDFDSDGNSRNWWTSEDKKEFERLSQQLVDQFNQYEVLDSLYINGAFTLSENMADLTGLIIPLKAYKNTLKNKPGPVIDDFSAVQRFFIAYAQAWMYKSRKEYLRRQVLTDPHSPEKFRVNGIVKNVDAFYDAFNVQENDSLFLDKLNRVRIW